MIKGYYFDIYLDGKNVMSVFAPNADQAKKKAVPDLAKSGYRNAARAEAFWSPKLN